MNNYYISVSIGILTKEHRERIGASLWEFLWCLDKITRIDPQGFGWVLNGKPILLADLADQMGVHEMTVSRNLARLAEQKYIKVIRTPRGLSLRVCKAQKRFNKKVDSQKVQTNENVESPNGNVDSTNENVESNKDITVDNTVDTTKAAKRGGKEKHFNPLGSEIIKAFEEVDPKNKRYYNNTTQRGACDFLLAEYGLEEVLKRISILPRTNKISFFPTINSPNELMEKWVKLQDAVDRKRAESKAKSTEIIR